MSQGSSSSSSRRHHVSQQDDDRKKPAVSKSRNPFSSRNTSNDRENFPNLESFFRTVSPPDDESSALLPMQPVASFPSHHDDEDGDFLNLSIGARAALTDHLRQVAKHGIDGEHLEDANTNNNKSLLDLKWEYFLEQQSDTSRVLDSSGTEASFPRSSKRLAHFDLFSNTSCLEQSMDVMTDISQNFFNSSRVQELSTPERNRDKIHHLSTRNDVHPDDDDDDDFLMDEQERADAIAPELLVLQSSSSEEHKPHNTTHSSSNPSSSFCAPDISRISSADESEVDMHHHHGSMVHHDVDGSPLFLASSSPPPIGVDSHYYDYPPHQHLDSSFASLPSLARSTQSSPPFHHGLSSREAQQQSPFSSALPSPPRHPGPLSPRRSYSAPLLAPTIDSSSLEKENYQPSRSNRANPHSGRRRRLGGGKEASSLSSSRNTPRHEHHFSASALDTMPADFMEAIEMTRVEEQAGVAGSLSPISQVGSSVSILYESSSSSSRQLRRGGRGTTLRDYHHHRPHGPRMVPYPSIAASMPTTNTIIAHDTSTSSSSSSSNNPSLTGRKRFRTVVPRRVYMGSPSQFPDEHDSFGHASTPNHNSSSSNDISHQRSLLDSFDEAAAEEDAGENAGCTACYSSY